MLTCHTIAFTGKIRCSQSWARQGLARLMGGDHPQPALRQEVLHPRLPYMYLPQVSNTTFSFISCVLTLQCSTLLIDNDHEVHLACFPHNLHLVLHSRYLEIRPSPQTYLYNESTMNALKLTTVKRIPFCASRDKWCTWAV